MKYISGFLIALMDCAYDYCSLHQRKIVTSRTKSTGFCPQAIVQVADSKQSDNCQGPPNAEEDTDAKIMLQRVIYRVPPLSCHLLKPSISHGALTCLTEKKTDNIQRQDDAHA
jgi:hypothetical protein